MFIVHYFDEFSDIEPLLNLLDEAYLIMVNDVFVVCRENLLKYHLTIKKLMANELRQVIRYVTIAGREKILENIKR